MLILLLPVRNQSMTRTLLYLIPGCTCAAIQGSHFRLIWRKALEVQHEKETVVTVTWRSYLGVFQSGCAILSLEGEEG